MNAIDARPSIVLSSTDVTQIERLLDQPEVEKLPVAALLAEEIARATVLPPSQIPPGVVTMNASLTCVEVDSGKEHHITLSYPSQADVAAGRISLLTPMGSALLGLSVGQSIAWPGPGGRALHVRVTEVTRQPGAAARH